MPKVTERYLRLTTKRRKQGLSYEEIAREIAKLWNVSFTAAELVEGHAADNKHRRELRRTLEARRSRETGLGWRRGQGYEKTSYGPSEATLADCEKRRRAGPQTIVAALQGDPLPGFDAGSRAWEPPPLRGPWPGLKPVLSYLRALEQAGKARDA